MADSKKPGETTGSNGGRPDAFLGNGSRVEGSLSFSGPVELNGFVKGDVHSQGVLTIGPSAEIHAKIEGSEITVRGTVHGDIEARKLLTLEGSAKVFGNIKAERLKIEQGVVFEGSCSMSTTPQVA
jgi:cytoskeletal protein CcmA (bactofilin family)